MSDSLPAVAFVWQSDSLTGAQRRFLAIARALETRGQRAIVLLEHKSVQVLEELSGGPVKQLESYVLPWWVTVFRWGRAWRPRLHRALGLTFLLDRSARHFWQRLLTQHHVGLVHVSMTSYIANAVTGPAVFEVTSPDWASKIIDDPTLVPRDMILHSVSESVDTLIASGLQDRKRRVAPIPFPSIDPALIGEPKMQEREKRIVFAHRLILRKHGVTFARAARRFLHAYPDWKVSLRGEGPEGQAIRKILAEEIGAGRVTFGYTSRLTDELQRSRIFVSIIEPDNYPSQSVIEAMICGNALLLSDRGQTRVRFIRGNGLLVEPNEGAVLAGLSHLVSDTAALDAMGVASYRLASERFSQAAYLDALVSVYREAGFEVSFKG